MGGIEDRQETLAPYSVQHLGEDPAAILRRGGVGRRGRIGREDRLADVEVGTEGEFASGAALHIDPSEAGLVPVMGDVAHGDIAIAVLSPDPAGMGHGKLEMAVGDRLHPDPPGAQIDGEAPQHSRRLGEAPASLHDHAEGRIGPEEMIRSVIADEIRQDPVPRHKSVEGVPHPDGGHLQRQRRALGRGIDDDQQTARRGCPAQAVGVAAKAQDHRQGREQGGLQQEDRIGARPEEVVEIGFAPRAREHDLRLVPSRPILHQDIDDQAVLFVKSVCYGRFGLGKTPLGTHRATAVQDFKASETQFGVGKSPTRGPASAGRSRVWRPRHLGRRDPGVQPGRAYYSAGRHRGAPRAGRPGLRTRSINWVAGAARRCFSVIHGRLRTYRPRPRHRL
jgi:hypothetical protein